MRRFPDFLKSYCAFYEGQIPAQFATWVGLSVVAGVLERKVWLPWTDTYSFYPNIYVLLTGGPGCRKSTAINYGVGMLRTVDRKLNTLNIMPDQITYEEMIRRLGHSKSFMHRWTEERVDEATGTKQLIPKELTIFQSSGYFYSSEASNSLKDISSTGGLIACLTDFYDCGDNWARATKTGGEVKLRNVCMNLLAGSTFDYLGKLINDENIQGGFASRNIYVVHRSQEVIAEKFAAGLRQSDRAVRLEYYQGMVDDLINISKMTGPMIATPEFAAAWEAWYKPFHEKLNALESESLRSILARTNTNVLKVSMLLSASESNDQLLKVEHWNKAVQLIEDVNAEVPTVFQEARAKQGPKTAGALTSMIMVAAKRPGATREGITQRAITMGYNSKQVEETLNALLQSDGLRIGAVVGGQGAGLKHGGKSNKYL